MLAATVHVHVYVYIGETKQPWKVRLDYDEDAVAFINFHTSINPACLMPARQHTRPCDTGTRQDLPYHTHVASNSGVFPRFNPIHETHNRKACHATCACACCTQSAKVIKKVSDLPQKGLKNLSEANLQKVCIAKICCYTTLPTIPAFGTAPPIS